MAKVELRGLRALPHEGVARDLQRRSGKGFRLMAAGSGCDLQR
jgi:hypothetical protein